uniref:Uncharacterized protein n=1 Tax=Streptomyces sp. F12 TaxID=1436084 RepID=V9Z9I9_9ACTN|nr:hypothetical protein [Streptomyces sp. F12]AHE40091.1 hypothetical protein pFRL6_4 [Streptomyces sp. F12]
MFAPGRVAVPALHLRRPAERLGPPLRLAVLVAGPERDVTAGQVGGIRAAGAASFTDQIEARRHDRRWALSLLDPADRDRVVRREARRQSYGRRGLHLVDGPATGPQP